MADKNEQNHKDLITYAFAEFAKAIGEAKTGRTPTDSYSKLKRVYDTLSEAEKKKDRKEITDLDLQNIMAAEVEKLKKDI